MVGLVKEYGVSNAMNRARQLRAAGAPLKAQQRLSKAIRRYPNASHLFVMQADMMAEAGAAGAAMVAYGDAADRIRKDSRLRPSSRRYLLTYVAARRVRLAEGLGLGREWRPLDHAVGKVPAPTLYRRYFPAP